MTFAQERMWLIESITDSDPVNNAVTLFRLRGQFDASALEQALTALHRRHEILRTSYSDKGQAIAAPAPIQLDLIDLSAAVDPARAAEERAKTAAMERLDLGTPPIRWTLMRLGEEDHALLLATHHIAWDGWSYTVCNQELSILYAAHRAGREPELPELPVQYADYAEWQRQQSEGESDLQFWEERLKGAPTTLRLPFDRPASAASGYGGACLPVIMEETVARQVSQLAKEEGTTAFAVLFAAFSVTLARTSRQDDLVVGVPVAGRSHPELEPLIGCFINMLPLRVDLAGNPTFRTLLRRVADASAAAQDHATAPLEHVIQRLAPAREPGRSPLIQTYFQVFEIPAASPDLDGLSVEHQQFFPPGTPLDLSLTLERRGSRLDGRCEFRTDLFDEATIAQILSGFLHVTQSAVRHPDQPASELAMLDSDAEIRVRQEARHLAGPAPTPFPLVSLHTLFEQQVARAPKRTAVVDDEGELTYEQLDARANRIAWRLRELGVGPDSPVAVLLHRSVDLPAALLGILKAGGAFLPIEPDTPTARIATLLADARLPICLAEPDLVPRVVEAGGSAITIAEATGGIDRGAPPVRLHQDNLCAVYYTSGSTGQPKGVSCTHGGWVNRMWWMQRRHGLRAGETVLQKTTLTFDDSAVEVFWPLMAGGRVAMLGPDLHRDPRAIIDAAVRHHSVHLNFVPSMLDLFVEVLTEQDVRNFASLRSVQSSGEALRPSLVRRFAERFGDAVALDNTWGATEVSVDSTCHSCGPADGHEQNRLVSLGSPFDNNHVYVVDGQWQLLPPGIAGELCIGGVGLARGYLNAPGRTASVFAPHPDRPGERLYHTGDRGRMRLDGTVEFLDRLDDQVKIRGVRIELGEVEDALRRHPGVADAAVVVWETAADKQLAAHVVLHEDQQPPTPAQLRRFLGEHLASYAIPGSITVLDELPRLTSGKLDRRALPEPDPRSLLETSYRAPESATEKAVARIWADTLGLPQLSADDDFFAIGGHSLLATRILSRMRRAFGLELPLSTMFERPSVASVAEQIERLVLAEVAALPEEEVSRRLAEGATVQ
ncbi:amino acid adenylation domain-containing protein [Streptomyces sp. NPDC023998]|uniref:non-ribosomal peptide synthetase n=1 Tax=Streptomyces sp. NPDC023998 TaxID=3154597 RepID=UPI0033CF1305